MCERSPGLPLLKGGLVRCSNPLDLFSGSVADIRGFIPLSDQQNKGDVHVSGGFRAPEANRGSPEQTIFVQFERPAGLELDPQLRCEGRDLCSQEGGGERKVRAGGPICVPLFRTVVEPPRSQLCQHDPALRHQLRSSSNRRQNQQTRNHRRRRRGQNGQAATPAAHVQTREHFGTEPKKRGFSKECEQKHSERIDSGA